MRLLVALDDRDGNGERVRALLVTVLCPGEVARKASCPVLVAKRP